MSRGDSTVKQIWLHRFVITVSIATFCLIIAGGLVTSTDSGLAVPDWPLSYGQLMPPMVGGIFYEHGHRMVATFVGFLTTIMSIWLWRVEDRKWVKVLGFISLFAVIAQGVLGGLTVLFLLPTWISVSHATLAQSFFCLTIVLALVTSPFWREHRPAEFTPAKRTQTLAVTATAAVFLQLILGGLMRHTGSGLAIPDFPLSYGNLLPPFDSSALPAINEYRMGWDMASVSMGQIWIHFAHRVGALLVAVVVIMNVFHILNTCKESKLREPAWLLLAFLVVQILLGALTVWTGKGIETATAHVATGALLLGLSVIISVRSFQLYRVPERSFSTHLAPELSR
jgi:cytochrome c oxidase assembly protein subunit 15